MSNSSSHSSGSSASSSSSGGVTPLRKPKEEWRQQLSDQEYEVMFNHGTERAWTGRWLENKEAGIYVCRACGLELFPSKTKFESGTGWPSFYDVANKGHIGETRDTKFGMVRTEVHCNRCGAHLGHVFDDGPRPTGLRYCINSVSLDFKPEGGKGAGAGK